MNFINSLINTTDILSLQNDVRLSATSSFNFQEASENVFEDLTAERTPAYLYFGVSEDIHILLRKASYLSSKSVVLFPVPHGTKIKEDEELSTEVSTQYLRDFINANSVVIDETPIDDELTDANEDLENIGE